MWRTQDVPSSDHITKLVAAAGGSRRGQHGQRACTDPCVLAVPGAYAFPVGVWRGGSEQPGWWTIRWLSRRDSSVCLALHRFRRQCQRTGSAALLFGFAVISGVGSWLIARRYEIEGDLRASQEHLSAVISNLPIILWALDRDGCVTLSEGSGLAALDVKPRELVGRSVFDMYRDVPEVIANTRRVLAGETFTVVVNLGKVDVETWYSPLRDRQGAVTGAIGVSLDVTERRAAEQVVIRSERRLQTIIDAQPACVKLVSPDGLVLDMNPAGLENGRRRESRTSGRTGGDQSGPSGRPRSVSSDAPRGAQRFAGQTGVSHRGTHRRRALG